jgi:hypothetical protein
MTPVCRIEVFATIHSVVTVRRRRKAVARGCGWVDWNPSPAQARAAGRPGFGSFEWPSPRAALRRARVIMRQDPRVEAIRIRTNGSRDVAYLRRDQIDSMVDVGPLLRGAIPARS